MQTQPRPRRAQPLAPLASGVHAAVKKKPKTPPPILASDVLREDLAPIEPGRKASRLWGGGAALLYLGVAICLRRGLGVSELAPQASAIALAAAAACGAIAVVPFPYLWRAIVGAFVGAAVVTLGLFGAGPLALLAAPESSAWFEGMRVVTCVGLPATLLFRSYYRAYQRGRALLLVAFALAVPFLVQEGIAATHGPGAARIGAALGLIGVVSGLFAFMSAPTKATTVWCAQALTGLLALDLGLRQLYAPPLLGMGPMAYTLTAVAFFTSVVPMSLGLFQTLAAVYGPEARMVDVHRPSQPSEQAPVVSE